jgi:DNA-directed RNA polymerase beta subunit
MDSSNQVPTGLRDRTPDPTFRVRRQAVEVPSQLETVNYGRYRPVVEIPDLVELQTKSYGEFLQLDVPAEKRKSIGLQALLEEIFPIESYDKEVRLEFIDYELSQPRYDPTSAASCA